MDPFRKKLLIRAIGSIVWLVGAIIVLPVLAYEGCKRFETPRTYYIDLDAAQRDGAILRGWIPPILPESARNITEWHDIDTNRGEVRFEFDPKDAAAFVAQLTPEGDSTTDYVYRDATFGTIFSFTVDAVHGKAFVQFQPSFSGPQHGGGS